MKKDINFLPLLLLAIAVILLIVSCNRYPATGCPMSHRIGDGAYNKSYVPLYKDRSGLHLMNKETFEEKTVR